MYMERKSCPFTGISAVASQHVLSSKRGLPQEEGIVCGKTGFFKSTIIEIERSLFSRKSGAFLPQAYL
jgi:hypothetical protein